MRTLPLFVAALAFPVIAFAATPDQDLEIRDVRYDEETGVVSVDVCGTDARVGVPYSINMEVDFKKDSYSFPPATAGADGCVTASSWASVFSSFSGQGGIPAGTYDLSVWFTQRDDTLFIKTINIPRSLPTAADLQFSDFDHAYVNATAIYYLRNMRIADGYDDNSFRPTATINRAEFTKIVTGAQFNTTDTIDSCLAVNPVLGFSDVSESEWFAKYICVAKSKGIVAGYPDGTFRPATTINFAEAAKILVRVFVGVAESDAVWYKPYAEKLASLHAIPMSITSFDQQLTRGEMAEMIYRLKMGIDDKPSRTFEEMTGEAPLSATDSHTQPPADNSAAGNTYTHPTFGVSFIYATDWPTPIVDTGPFDMSGNVPDHDPLWQILIGDACFDCAGGSEPDIYPFELLGYDESWVNEIEEELRNNNNVDIITETIINDADVTIYVQDGYCVSLRAFLVTDEHAYVLHGQCAGDARSYRSLEFYELLHSLIVQ